VVLQAIARAQLTPQQPGDKLLVAHTCEQNPPIELGQPSVKVEGFPISHMGSFSVTHSCSSLTLPPLSCEILHKPWVYATTKTVLVGATNGQLLPVGRDFDLCVDDQHLQEKILQQDYVFCQGPKSVLAGP
jgi:hypothetical protein